MPPGRGADLDRQLRSARCGERARDSPRPPARPTAPRHGHRAPRAQAHGKHHTRSRACSKPTAPRSTPQSRIFNQNYLLARAGHPTPQRPLRARCPCGGVSTSSQIRAARPAAYSNVFFGSPVRPHQPPAPLLPAEVTAGQRSRASSQRHRTPRPQAADTAPQPARATCCDTAQTWSDSSAFESKRVQGKAKYTVCSWQEDPTDSVCSFTN